MTTDTETKPEEMTTLFAHKRVIRVMDMEGNETQMCG